jgi:predicted SAM-dependent methyltransferase
MSRRERVQYGCGFSTSAKWRNFDGSPTLRFERTPLLGRFYTKNADRFPANVEYGDIVRGLPVPDDSCKLVYCSHVLEHLALDDMRTALRNTYRILENGGRFRLVLPDLEKHVNDYVHDHSEEAAISFIRSTALGRERRGRSIRAFLLEWLGSGQHLWMWDYKSMSRELREAGFTEIRRASFGDSHDPAFLEVEDEERWRGCLGVECMK